MGGIHRLKKQLVGQSPMMMADTGIKFNGHKVLMAIGSLNESGLAKKFAGYIGFISHRANQVNMGDMLEAQVKFREGILN